MKRAALYIRVSTLDQHPETQLHELLQFASQRGFQIVDEYTDHGISGTKARRPALEHFHLRYIVDSAVTEPGLGVLWCDLG